MRKIVALLFILLAQSVVFLVLFGIIPLDDIPYITSMNKNSVARTLPVMVDSFLELKIMAQALAPKRPPLEAWVYLDEVQKKNDVEFRLYNSLGVRSVPPGAKAAEHKSDPRVMRAIETGKEQFYFEKSEVFYAIPLYTEKKCAFCHVKDDDALLGVASISYKDAETPAPRYLINLLLVAVSLINSFAAVLIILHDPFSRVKELFDKK